MALPKKHFICTLPILIASIFLMPPFDLKGLANLAGTIFFGIFIDVDHFSWRRIVKITSRDISMPTSLPQKLKIFCEFFLITFRVLILGGKKKGEKGQIPDWTNYLHTWQAALIITVSGVCITVWSCPFYFPVLAYWWHIIIDSAYKGRLTIVHNPLPAYLNRFVPEKWKYDFHPVI